MRRQVPVFGTKQALWVSLLISGAVAALLYLATAALLERDARQRFADQTRTAERTISARIKSYADLLRAARGLFDTHYPLTRREFRDYVTGLALAREFPAIATMNFAESVARSDIPALERRMRAERFPDDPLFLAKAGPWLERSEILTMIEPPRKMAANFGRDLGGPGRSFARPDIGQLRVPITRIPTVSQANRAALGVRIALYRTGMPLEREAERRAAFYGSIGVGLDVSRLIEGVLGEIPTKHVRLTLADPAMHADPDGGAVLFDSSATARQPTPPLAAGTDSFSSTGAIDFHGRPWLLTFSAPKAALSTGIDDYFASMAAVAGFISAMLACAFFRALTASRQRAIILADGMTRALRASQAKLQQSHQRLRHLAAHADQIKEAERKRIAREIHDDLGQNLLALRIEAGLLAAATSARHRRLHERVCATMAQIDATVRSVRQMINELRPNVLDLGLPAAIEWQLRELRQRTGLVCKFYDHHDELELDEQGATAFFRILQEALSNIVQHANATLVAISLRVESGWLTMTVNDDGIGLPTHARSKRGAFGLVGIEERISMLGGRCEVSGGAGQGTSISVSAPVRNWPGARQRPIPQTVADA